MRTVPCLIRSATEADAAALLAIYAPVVEHTATSFELVPPSVEDFAGRIRKSLADWAWLLAEVEGQVAGYAYGSTHRARPAYRWSVETSAYVHAGFRRRGLGHALYIELFEVLANRGYCHAFAGITLPNEPSVALHTGLGFQPIGVFRSVGWKFGAWQDVAWFQRPLRHGPPEGEPGSG